MSQRPRQRADLKNGLDSPRPRAAQRWAVEHIYVYIGPLKPPSQARPRVRMPVGRHPGDVGRLQCGARCALMLWGENVDRSW
eukprot:7378232-Prymnesium_polylepis.1